MMPPNKEVIIVGGGLSGLGVCMAILFFRYIELITIVPRWPANYSGF
jgi:succinate dehydrogenase/fumarate reductase flavoprotein subunit